jgi:hypothetical protein
VVKPHCIVIMVAPPLLYASADLFDIDRCIADLFDAENFPHNLTLAWGQYTEWAPPIASAYYFQLSV